MKILYLSLAAGVLAQSVGAGGTEPPEPWMNQQGYEQSRVFDFETVAEPWPNIDDPVMGGRSRSSMSIEGGVAVFEGVVSLENNGGFASLRSRPAEHDLSGFDGIAVKRSARSG